MRTSEAKYMKPEGERGRKERERGRAQDSERERGENQRTGGGSYQA